MTKQWQAYAFHIVDAIAKIRRIQARGSIAEDEVLYDATLRNLQTMSEATQGLPQDLKVGFPDIPWRDISGFRNILTHNYLGDIDPLTIVAVFDRHLPALEAAVLDMLASDGAPAAGAGARRDE
ncbi:HepT-like ribonuclease domain-containing protein [Parazoarcus communis]|uniref:DUF86 domain-containing protein n=1 Tax=Parazoarcus communis SWub3 = DSM 12120 TaxID=1121029 RepID=A0A323UNF0_9RHOO|nr:HepT-like ribonuclease domain-containing protein [Parazoarcus communis]NMG72079.1 DUF86 domain-containing protein [Parazoarcus communis SWub3 = DSM 12120]PZA14522.1 hypothetical protein DNK49_21270 [Azoarcus communis] [Parazoarcus communis SWub3 = DSM 12120]